MSRSEGFLDVCHEVGGAIRSFRRGEPVLIRDFDDREAETDLVYPAARVTAGDVARMRNDAGGLVCVALSDTISNAYDLPFLADAVEHPSAGTADIDYDDHSSFSLTVNHRETRTGITDLERAKTIRALATAAADTETFDFAATFRSPGHVHVLRAAPGLLASRQGHTELSLALAEAADLTPATVVCEMLDDDTGTALSRADAKQYARETGIWYVEGRDIVSLLR
ncbi:3,4-dihydroxy-2-butanone-4-phosphate synthase [Haloglomus litoreum]|uniref:3,4-dihydroxy-2-butanone-4-phosphate synthase n=1 Tax=Haloglomus litoreum TaxID=3034026 RepID=UPI0023E86095|nr:3,4-dihydroxy-2-butanone-4-phosphate synthase [Haloglomus sp. DT116]